MGLGPDLPSLTRRTALRLLMVGAVGLLAGCRSSKRPAAAPTASSPPSPVTSSASPSVSPVATLAPPTVSPTLSPDEMLAKRVALAEAQLLSAYDDAASDHPELAGLLAPLRADHAAHADALVPGAASPPPPPTPPSSAPSSSAPPFSSSPAGTPPPNPILSQLADVERRAAAARIDDLATTTGSLARLLASISGCEAAHAALLSVAT